MSEATSQVSVFEQKTGHPPGLFVLFFAEMWERFSYYGMRALLVFYMMKGFLSYGDKEAYAVYGAYTALVYATPFIGGMLSDKFLGARRAVVIGGVLMAAGHLLMTLEASWSFFGALALLICGNGFFKPNISTMVGNLYAHKPHLRDGAFTIFYMGINLGAAMSPLLCGYIGEKYGWHYGFGLATIGMLVGLAVFVASARVTQLLILGGAAAAATTMVWSVWENTLLLGLNIAISLALLAAAAFAGYAAGQGAIPDELGAPPANSGGKRSDALIYAGILIAVPLIALLIRADGLAGNLLTVLGVVALSFIVREMLRGSIVERHRLGVVLILMFFSMLFWAFFEQAGSSVNTFTDRNIDRVFSSRVVTTADVGQTLQVELTQAQIGYAVDAEQLVAKLQTTEAAAGTPGAPPAIGSIGQAKTDQQGAVSPTSTTPENLNDAGQPLQVVPTAAPTGAALDPEKPVEQPQPTQAAASMSEAQKAIESIRKAKRDQQGRVFLTLTMLEHLKKAARSSKAGENAAAKSLPVIVSWKITEAEIGMKLAESRDEVPASIFQSANPIFILLFGLLFSAMWAFLAKRGLEPSTPIKFGLGLLQLGLGFAAFWYGARVSTTQGMVGLSWLLLGYLLHTTGELCISPVGLSMVTRLSPARIVSTVMGSWFLATAFSNYLAGMIAALTGVSHGEDGGGDIPLPIETVHVYGDVFGEIAVAACASALIVFMLSPLLRKWMHEDA